MKIVDPAKLTFKDPPLEGGLVSHQMETLLAAATPCLDEKKNSPPPLQIAVAVSGGADSLALTLWLHEWAAQKGAQIIGLTVDHGLRATSAQEATQVAQWLKDKDIPHAILKWTPQNKTTSHEEAREARYELLLDWCRTHAIPYLCTAHHQEDVAETVLMRFMSGSGLDGLSGIAPLVETPAVSIMRPLLKCPKDSLKAYLQSQNQPWIEDPSNENTLYKRTRMRDFMAQEGLSAERLSKSAEKMIQTRNYFDHTVTQWLAEQAQRRAEGFYLLNSKAFFTCHPEIKHRIMAKVLGQVGGSIYPPRSKDLSALLNHMQGDFSGKTLNGCQVSLWRDNILISREERAIEPGKILSPGNFNHWDQRFSVKIYPQNSIISKLGVENWSHIRTKIDPDLAASIPAQVKPTLPAVFLENQLVAVPHLNYNPENLSLEITFLPRSDLFIPKFETLN